MTKSEKAVLEIEYQIDIHLSAIVKSKERIKELKKQLNEIKGREIVPWTEKAIKCIKAHGEFLTTDEILKTAFINQPEELENSIRRRGYITALSVALQNLCKSRKLMKIEQKGIRGAFYGFPEWFRENGDLDSYYKYRLDVKYYEISNSKKNKKIYKA